MSLFDELKTELDAENKAAAEKRAIEKAAGKAERKAAKKEFPVDLMELTPVSTVEELHDQMAAAVEDQKYVTFGEVAKAIGHEGAYRPDVTAKVLRAVGETFECIVVSGKGTHHFKVAEAHAEKLAGMGYEKFPVAGKEPVKKEEEVTA